MAQKYIPGVCNIGPAEIRRRNIVGITGFVVSAILLIWFYYAAVPDLLRLFVIIPAFIGAMGFLQAQFHFCAKFGMSGIFNVSDDDIQRTESIDQAEFRRKDRQKALSILAYSIAIAWAIALTAYLLPYPS